MALPKSLRDTAFLLRQLPQIGPRQAGRLALFLFRNDAVRQDLIVKLQTLQENAVLCEQCFRITETSPCGICADKNRDAAMLMVVEEDTDLDDVEKTHAFTGRYFVLGGRFNPNRGTPQEQGLRAKELKELLAKRGPKLHEVILAMNPTVEGDMLALNLLREFKQSGIPFTRLGRGLPVGGEIEYADEETLKSALEHRG